MNDRDVLALMEDVAREAAAVINEVYETKFVVDYKAPRDPVTEADRRANELICQRLTSALPDVPVVAEESDPVTFSGFRTARRVFFVDPLDGTREFVKKSPEFVVMVGLLDGATPVAGVVYAPATGITWSALKGAGAWKTAPDGSRSALGVSPTGSLGDARVVATRSHRSPALEQALGALGAARLDALGSAGLKCVEVAAGDADAYVAPARAGSRWDLCAGQAIIESAGGRLTDAWGDPIDYRGPSLTNDRGIVASNAILHAEILQRLAEARARHAAGGA